MIQIKTQKEALKKLNKIHTYQTLFEKPKHEEEFQKYWKKYSKRMIEAQELDFVKKARKYFQAINKEKSDDIFARRYFIKMINSVKGYGLFAKEKVEKGTILTHYAGIMRKDLNQTSKKNRYVFGLTGTRKLEDWIIDAKTTCNVASLMNHSHKPNVDAVEFYDYDGPKVVFEALRDIEPEEEMMYDYGKEYWEGFGEKPQ